MSGDFRTAINTISMAQSEVVTAAIEVRGYKAVGIQFPILTSCTLTAEVGVDANSASFVPLDGFSYTTETGSKAIIATGAENFSHLRLRSSVAQAAQRIFTIYGKAPRA